MAGRIAAFWDSALVATYGFTGNETIGILCHETEKQRKNLPKAVQRISKRIIAFYIFAVLGLGLTVYKDDPILRGVVDGQLIRNYPGGFIIMAERSGIPVLPDFINCLMILAAFSMANAGLFVAVHLMFLVDLTAQSQALQALANEGYAPRFLIPEARVETGWVHVSRPRLYAVGISACPAVLAYLSLGPNSNFVCS